MSFREAMLYESLSGNRVLCNVCARRCVVAEGEVGFCKIRKNIGGKFFSLVYGLAALDFKDPIEKKGLFHFNPGSMTYSFGTMGCNFRCRFCINYYVTLSAKNIDGQLLPPREMVALAKQNDCEGISYTYNEPTVFFEYAYDTARLAHKVGFFNTFVTNGYMTPEAVHAIAPFLDAATVDFKGGGDPTFYRRLSGVPRVEPIFECLKSLKKHGIHVEVTNLIVEKYGGDSMEQIRSLAGWIRDNLGRETPLHFLRYRPQAPMVMSMPLPEVEEKAYEISRDEGLRYIYNREHTNTYCLNCNALLIERARNPVVQYVTDLKINPDNTCPNCGKKATIVGQCNMSKEVCSCGGVGFPPSALGVSTDYWGYEG